MRPRWSDFDELPIPEHRLPHPPASSAPVLRDIRLWTAEQSGRVGEVLASSAVTQLIVRLRHADGKGWYSAPKRLVFGGGELAALPLPVDDDDRPRAEGAAEEDDEGPAAWARAPSAMHLLLKLGDMELVTVKVRPLDARMAASLDARSVACSESVGLSGRWAVDMWVGKAYEVDTWGGSSELVEREFVFPLNKRERIGDVLHRIKR